VYSLSIRHTTASHFSNIRIGQLCLHAGSDEAGAAAAQPDGLLIVNSGGYAMDCRRLHALLQDLFGEAPVQFQSDPGFLPRAGRFFVAGSRRAHRESANGSGAGCIINAHSNMPMEPARVTTDDWPYFYHTRRDCPCV